MLKCLLFCNFIIFIGTNLLIVAKVHKFLFYNLLCRKKMNMEENRSIWQYWELPKIHLLNTFQRSTRKGLKKMSNEKVINMKVVKNFNLYDLESKIVQNGVIC
jgi:hypothetical protein